MTNKPPAASGDSDQCLAQQLADIRETFGSVCNGAWLSGSGGHARFSNDCNEPAEWVYAGDSWCFCADHFPGIGHPSVKDFLNVKTVLAAAEACLRDHEAALRAAAKEAQLRLLNHWPARDIDDQARIDARIRKVKKEGPL